jgi:hypothetical protein
VPAGTRTVLRSPSASVIATAPTLRARPLRGILER